MSLGEQIAVLDGLGALDPSDGRIGQERARIAQYARQAMPNVLRRSHVLDASEGGNYSGGSSYADGLPLMPSSIGLAGLRGLRAMPGVLPTRQHVIDYSGGALYSGGSSYTPGLPLLPSSSGLAAQLIEGGYGRAGLGASMIQGGYGRAGLGQTGSVADEDLAAAAESIEVAKRLDPADGRIGQQRAQVDEYGRPIMPGVLARSNVLDPSEGGNYSGGSSYEPGIPLLPSSSGLAGFAQSNGYGRAGLGAVGKAARKVVTEATKLRMKMVGDASLLARTSNPEQRSMIINRLHANGALYNRMRVAVGRAVASGAVRAA